MEQENQMWIIIIIHVFSKRGKIEREKKCSREKYIQEFFVEQSCVNFTVEIVWWFHLSNVRKITVHPVFERGWDTD